MTRTADILSPTSEIRHIHSSTLTALILISDMHSILLSAVFSGCNRLLLFSAIKTIQFSCGQQPTPHRKFNAGLFFNYGFSHYILICKISPDHWANLMVIMTILRNASNWQLIQIVLKCKMTIIGAHTHFNSPSPISFYLDGPVSCRVSCVRGFQSSIKYMI